jgi:hypothetical protein
LWISEDSGEAARLFRDDGAHDSGTMTPGSAATLAVVFWHRVDAVVNLPIESIELLVVVVAMEDSDAV